MTAGTILKFTICHGEFLRSQMTFHTGILGVLSFDWEFSLVVIKFCHPQIGDPPILEVVANLAIRQSHISKFVRIIVAGRAFSAET